jgi:hypothetical protein
MESKGYWIAMTLDRSDDSSALMDLTREEITNARGGPEDPAEPHRISRLTMCGKPDDDCFINASVAAQRASGTARLAIKITYHSS